MAINNQQPEAPKPPPPPPKAGEIPPHILKELFDIKEKIGRLEGMMEVILKQLNKEK